MIHLCRSAEPAVLAAASARRKTAEKKIQKIIDAGNTPKSDDFNSLWGERSVRSSLWKMQHGRCCYCERLRDEIRESDIEHFRPKTKIDGESGPGYWWLAFEWENLFFSCRLCNQQYKKTGFPIRGTRARKPADNLDAEKALPIDPAKEDPERWIGFDWSIDGLVFIYGRGTAKRRATETIKLCGLDRSELNEERFGPIRLLELLRDLMHEALVACDPALITKYEKMIRDETSARKNAAFVGLRRAFFREAGLGNYVSSDC